QSAHDLKLQLQWIAAGGTQMGVPAPAAAQRKRTGQILLGALTAGWILAIASAILALMYAGRLNSARQLVRAEIGLPSGFDLADASNGAPVLSPDGQRLAFIGVTKAANQGDGPSHSIIIVRQMGTGEAGALTGTENSTFPFWSPDGRYLGFFADGKL